MYSNNVKNPIKSRNIIPICHSPQWLIPDIQFTSDCMLYINVHSLILFECQTLSKWSNSR